MKVHILDTSDDSRNYPNGCSQDETNFERVHREMADIRLDRYAESHGVAVRITALNSPRAQ